MSGIISNILQGIIGLAGVVIAGLVYALSRQQKREAWLRTYKELHETFWSDVDFKDVRAWLACDESYSKIRPVFKKRQAIDEEGSVAGELSEEEYRVLEKMDRFLNFLMRVVVINPEFKRRRDLWEKLYFDYWLMQFGIPSRPELAWYLRKFYGELDGMLQNSIKAHAS